MANKTLDYNKLDKINKDIIDSAYLFGYVTNRTYSDKKDRLVQLGWLRGRRVGDAIISGCYELTDAGRAALKEASDG